MKRRVIITHGWDANPTSNWFQWLAQELTSRGFEVEVPSLPTPATPDVDAWVGTLAETVGAVNEQTFFVGHSLGCITIARFLATLSADQVSGACVFVAGFSGNIKNPATMDFYKRDLDIEVVKARCKKFAMIFSDDDPMVPPEKSQDFGKKLGAELIEEKGKGHFVGSLGCTELPIALNTLLRLTS